MEKISGKEVLVVSDLHDRDLELERQLSDLAVTAKPDIVIFLGDILGTKALDTLQKLFYNGIFNPVKKLLEKNPKATNRQLLRFKNADKQAVSKGVKNTLKFLIFLTIPSTLLNRIRFQLFYFFSATVKKRADFARKLSRYVHFGHFCSNLDENERLALRRGLETNAQAWYDIMEKFTQNGAMVYINEGNWDARHPLDFKVGQECIPVPIEERDFYLKSFLEAKNNPNLVYFDEVGVVSTNDYHFVFWPFDAAIKLEMIPEFEENDDRKVILVSHAQIKWNAVKGSTPKTNEGKIIEEHMGEVVHDLKPYIIIHGHLHDSIGDVDGYLLEDETPVFYLPLRQFKFINF